ncbi:hypothetical protein [Mesorhizobium retamae]|uniref:Deoxynucleotide monophosphate kinase n=1 Tax=Mesorhizobium retamae TaxID=2912854 RepID=A0ABS9QHV1_9HYPH|nr:hypothetical protein [Mesorhizobium sp. IRAMC:0171]MCG7507032.1 hypothetical protein [Mesorhizobium sp. IRAMC:0171]
MAYANDNLPLPMIGLTGRRNVGKSTVANLLVKEFGYQKAHAFEVGLEAAREFFIAMGFDADDAWEMTYGDLKDVPNEDLPGGVAPRYYLEKSGHFHATVLGTEWTLALAIKCARRRAPHAPIVVESLVYEAPWFKQQGGIVWRLERPGHEGPAGVESDKVQALIVADEVIAAVTKEELLSRARESARRMVD